MQHRDRVNADGSENIEYEELHALALTLLLPRRALSYIGAGTGSLIIQVVIASLVGVLVVLKLYWQRIKAFFTRGRARDAAPEADAEGATLEAEGALLMEGAQSGEPGGSPEAELLPAADPEPCTSDPPAGETGKPAPEPERPLAEITVEYPPSEGQCGVE